MQKMIIGGVVAFAMSTSALAAAPLFQPSGLTQTTDQVWLAKNDKGNGGKKVKGNGKPKKPKGRPDHAGGKPKASPGGSAAKDKPAKPGKPDKVKQKAPANGNGKARGPGHRAWTTSERDEEVRRLVEVRAPEGRDMARILGLAGLALATPQLVVAEVPEAELITYANCPPGLAKKDPPCVPPGLAKQGVTFDEWASYDRDRYDELWLERRATVLDRDFDPDPELLLLQSDQIAALFDLAVAPEGQRYALIDGLPVLLDEEDYASFLLLNELAQVAQLDDGLRVAPTAALTQSELMSLYRLPQLADGQNYSVVNGQILQLSDSEYELLQLIRVARAVL